MAKDIIYRDGDIVIENGDFLLEEAENSNTGFNYHAVDIMLSSKGSWYQSPLMGVGIDSSLNGNYDPKLKSEINKQLRDDKFQINSLSVIFAGKTVDIEVNATKDTK